MKHLKFETTPHAFNRDSFHVVYGIHFIPVVYVDMYFLLCAISSLRDFFSKNKKTLFILWLNAK